MKIKWLGADIGLGKQGAVRRRAQGKRCEELSIWLSAYIDGELESVEMTPFRCRVEEHLERCSGCSSLVEQWSHDAAMLAVPVHEVPAAPWFKNQFLRRLSEAKTGRRELRLAGSVRWLLWRSLPIAVVAVGLLLGAGIRTGLQPQPMATALGRGLDEFDVGILAANSMVAGRRAAVEALDFDEVLRSAGNSSELGRENESAAGVRLVAGGSRLSGKAIALANRVAAELGLPEKDR